MCGRISLKGIWKKGRELNNSEEVSCLDTIKLSIKKKYVNTVVG